MSRMKSMFIEMLAGFNEPRKFGEVSYTELKEEVQLINDKKSRLSRSDRDQVLKEFNFREKIRQSKEKDEISS